MKRDGPELLARVVDYLRHINPTVLGVDAATLDNTYSLRLELGDAKGVREIFPSQNLSDGTLRALAVLTALFQPSDRGPAILTGLEEPEAGLHPAAAAVLFDALMESSQSKQLLVTSHSPDLLDRDDIEEEAIQAVAMFEGRTIIGRVDAVGRAALRDRLYTPGELMRMDQLRPEGIPEGADVRP